MPRRARVVVANMPHHIVQRGHNRGVVFTEKQDYEYYLANLYEWKMELGLELYSYCLMTNHIHLIVRASEDPADVSALMKRLAGRQTRFANRLNRSTGSLWDGRYKVSPIQTDKYLLQCCRYVELNPVKAGMVQSPEDYFWSSYREKVGLETCLLMDADPVFEGLGGHLFERQERYKKFVNAFAQANKEQRFIGQAVERNQLTGDIRFVNQIEAQLGLRIEFRGRGRPLKSK